MAVEGAIVNPNGSAQVITDHMSLSAQAALADTSLVWVNPSEPSVFIGGVDAPLAAALNGDGSALEHVLVEHVGRSEALDSIALSAGSSSALGRFTAVYARSIGAVFLVGLHDTSYDPVQSLRWFDVASGAVVDRTLDAPVGKVLAATYSFRDGHIHAFDEVGTTSGTVARLISIAPRTGMVTVAQTFARTGDYDWHSLGVDPGGHLVLAASSETLDEHAVVRILIGSTPTPDVIRGSASELSYPLRVDARGFVLHVRDGAGLDVVRLSTLGTTSATWTAIGALL